MRYHGEQTRLVLSPARFRVVPAGRRSGKTERAKRFLVKEALGASRLPAAYGACAPTRDQAKKIFWQDFKELIPKWAIKDISESLLIIRLYNGAEIHVIGMDRPERIEGMPWAGLILDEFANMKPEAWSLHVRPALSDVRCADAWCWFTGVPEGRNHYYDLWKGAIGPWNINSPPSEVKSKDGTVTLVPGNWDGFTWPSADILDPIEVAQAQLDLDELSFEQEYRGSFVNFQGMAYYCWSEQRNQAPLRHRYVPSGDLVFMFDFNVDPGVAAIGQEMRLPIQAPSSEVVLPNGLRLFRNVIQEDGYITGTAIIGEVYIPRNSNTVAVCNKLIEDWGSHKGRIFIYGDATGGVRKTSATEGSDWDLVKTTLYNHFGSGRVHFRVPESNPTERARINAVNTRLRNTAGEVRLMVDPQHAPQTVKDFEGVRLLEGGSGEIDKKHDPKLTHVTDAIGYYVARAYPVRKPDVGVEELRI